MKFKDNFYFYFSVASLIFSLILIYHFYEMNYRLSNFLDVKTLLLVLGTIVGAYLGASKAGKYSVNVMMTENELSKRQEEEREQLNERKYRRYLLARVKNARVELDSLLNQSNQLVKRPGYITSMRSNAENINKIEVLFDNIDYLKFDEEMIDHYINLQTYLEGIYDISLNLIAIHESHEKSKNFKEHQISETQMQNSIAFISNSLNTMRDKLSYVINEIESN